MAAADRTTLQILAQLAEIGIADALAVPLGAFDPLLRPMLRGRVRRALDAARAASPSSGEEHLLRLAFLLLNPERPAKLEADDPIAVSEAFHALSPAYLAPSPVRPRTAGGYRASAERHGEEVFFVTSPKPSRRFWPITTPLVIASVLGTLAAVGTFVAPYVWPTPEDRFRKTALGVAMGDPLTDFVAAERQGGDTEARDALLSPSVAKQVGKVAAPLLAQALDGVLEATDSRVESPDEAMAPLFATLNGLNGELARARIPALFHAYGARGTEGHSVWVTGFFVARRDELAMNGERLHVAWGRRIDRLNLQDSALYKADKDDWALLSLDLAEEDFVQYLLRPIAEGRSLGPEEWEASDVSPPAELARAEGRLVAEELQRASRLDSADALGVYRALVSRNAAASDLSKAGYAVGPTSRLQLRPSLVRALTRARGGEDDHLLQELLATNDRMALYRRQVASAVDQLALVEEEEFAVRLAEDKRLEGASVPALAKANLDSRSSRGLAASELELLARPRACPRLALWWISRRVTQGGQLQQQVAWWVVSSVLSKLGLGAGPMVNVELNELDAQLKRAFEAPPEKVAAAAQGAWQEAFGGSMPALTRTVLE